MIRNADAKTVRRLRYQQKQKFRKVGGTSLAHPPKGGRRKERPNPDLVIE